MVESVEFHRGTGLLIIRNPILNAEQEQTILEQNGWSEAAESDLPEAGLPPTPRLKGPSLFGLGRRDGSKPKRGLARCSTDSDRTAESGKAIIQGDANEVSDGGVAAFEGNKRVYKRAVGKEK